LTASARKEDPVITRLLAASSTLLAAAGLALSPCSLAATEPPVEVNAAAGWVETGIWVGAGETVSVAAVGRAFTTLPAASTDNAYFPPLPGSGRQGVSGPDGQPYICTSYTAGTCAVEDAPFGELVGQVGNIGFPVGAGPTFTVPATATAGYLRLAVNDFIEWYFDNSGSYLVSFP
jgi:hypothetical protein